MHYSKRYLSRFRGTVPRDKLVETVAKADDSFVVLAAPAGYGKSVLASQLAGIFEGEVIWLDCSGLEWNREQLFSALDDFFGAGEGRVELRSAPSILNRNTVDLVEGVRSSLERFREGKGVTVVLDDMPVGADVAAVRELTGMLEMLDSSRVIVTTRWESPEVFEESEGVTLLQTDHLKLSEEECWQVLKRYLTGEADAAAAEELMKLSAGRAATACVLARHIALGSFQSGESGSFAGPAPLDLVAHLNKLADMQLDDRLKAVLYTCALLKSGTGEEAEAVVGRPAVADIQMLGKLMPLVTVSGAGEACRFRVHDLAAEIYEERCFTQPDSNRFQSDHLLRRALGNFDATGRYDALFALALRRAPLQLLAEWMEKAGNRLYESGELKLLSMAFSRLGPVGISRSSKLLFWNARLLRAKAEKEDALRLACAAYDLAIAEGNEKLAAEALMLRVCVQMDDALMAEATQILSKILEMEVDDDVRALAHSYLGVCFSYLLDMDKGLPHIEKAIWIADNKNIHVEVEALVRNNALFVDVSVYGNLKQARRRLSRLLNMEELSLTMQIHIQGNLNAIHCELGRLDCARQLTESTITTSKKHGLTYVSLWQLSNLATAAAGMGDYGQAKIAATEAYDGNKARNFEMELSRLCTYRSAWTRAAGEHEQALIFSETALEHATRCSGKWVEWLATLEFAANLLVLQDAPAAEKHAKSVRDSATKIGAAQYALIADMILAESDRRKGDLGAARKRLAPHAEYVLSEYSNWWIGMYIRAFPHLLGLLSEVADPDRLSRYLLKMVLPDDVEKTLIAALEVIRSKKTWKKLALRFTCEETVDRIRQQLKRQDADVPMCKVRMFGGLEVRVGDRSVREKDWKKRKARLLFAMLVFKQGQDVPVDVIFDYLWPDKDSEKAQNNLYVIWSAMKSALLSKADRKVPLPYLEHVGGMCRMVSSLVSVDISEFGALRSEAIAAERMGDMESALGAYERLDELYVGELLPGDLYDDWFTDERDRYRIGFGDSMLRATEIAAEMGDNARALRFSWRGVAADAWREDLHQNLMKQLATAGQRSTAIEVYMKFCKRLNEDLGMDPSSETAQIYHQILSMEQLGAPRLSDPRDEDAATA